MKSSAKGVWSLLNTSLRIPPRQIARWQWNKTWSIVSKFPHNQHLPFSFQLLLTKHWATWRLLLKTCRRKNLLFKGILHFHKIPTILLVRPISVRNLYKDLVANCLLLSSSSTEDIESGLFAKDIGWRSLTKPSQFCHSWGDRDLLKSTSKPSVVQQPLTEQLESLSIL